MKVIHYLIPLLLAVVVCSCDISDNTAEPKDSFLKIYDNNNFDASFLPIDIKQTPDEEYLILGARRIENSDFTGVYIMKVDKNGEFVAENQLSEDLVHPVNSLMHIGEQYYFVAMNNISLQVNLIAINPDSLTTTATPLSGLSYPLAAHQADDEIILLSYNNDDKNSVLSVLNAEGVLTRQEAFSIGAGSDVEAPIAGHFTRTGKHQPFFTGKVDGGNLYYFNGFFNYTLSLVFTDLDDSGPDGVIQGQQDDGGVSAALNLGSSNFALSRFNFGDNYLLPNENLTVIGTSSSTDIEGNPFPELVADAPVIIKSVEINSETITLFASNTKSKQVVLLAFNSSGELLGSKYIGYSDPYEVSGFTQTSDDGLAVAGTVYVAGRFARIFVKKFSADELGSLIN